MGKKKIKTISGYASNKKVRGRRRKGKDIQRQVKFGQVHIQATYNNTIVTFCDLNGNVLGGSSAGVLGYKGAKKATPYAASQIVENAFNQVKPYLSNLAKLISEKMNYYYFSLTY